MKTKKKLKLAKIISVVAMVGFLGLAIGLYLLEVYIGTIVCVALEVVAAIVMVILFRMYSCEVYNHLGKELVLFSGMNGVSLTYDGTKYLLDRTQKDGFKSVYACTIEGGTVIETMVSSKKILAAKANGSPLQKLQ